MANIRPRELTESITFRLTPGEKGALLKLARRQAEQMEEHGFPVDPTFGGWIRGVIRKEAKAAGIAYDADVASERATPPAKRKRGS